MSDTTDRVTGAIELVSAGDAARHVARNDTLLTSGFGSVGYPKAVPLALAEDDRKRSLTLVSGGSVGEEIDTRLIEAGQIERRFPYQVTADARKAVNDRKMAFHDRHISRLGDEVEFGHLVESTDVAVVEAIAIGSGWLIPSLSIGHTPTYVDAADRLIVEVNTEVPLQLQEVHDVFRRKAPPARAPFPLQSPEDRIEGPRIEFDPDKLVAVVETDRPDRSYKFRSPTGTDNQIAANLSAFLEQEFQANPLFDNHAYFQFGVGSLGNALMGTFREFDFGSRTIGYFGEVIQDGLLDMIDDGKLSAASATSLALSLEGRQQLYENIDRYAEDIVLRPANLSNSPELITRFGIIAINSALEVDLYGHANSTHVAGSHVLNGIGGSGDFIRNAAISIVALPSTVDDGPPRIVPMVPHVDHTEHDISVVITEQGVADLRGLAPIERARTLIHSCAHPDDRADLRAYLERATRNGGHMPHDLTTAFDTYQD